jgi:hypothetical protein
MLENIPLLAFHNAKSASLRFSVSLFAKEPSPSACKDLSLRFHGSSLAYGCPAFSNALISK